MTPFSETAGESAGSRASGVRAKGTALCGLCSSLDGRFETVLVLD